MAGRRHIPKRKLSQNEHRVFNQPNNLLHLTEKEGGERRSLCRNLFFYFVCEGDATQEGGLRRDSMTNQPSRELSENAVEDRTFVQG